MYNMNDESGIQVGTILNYRVTKADVRKFKERMLDEDQPNEFYIESIDGIFRVNKEKMLFSVLCRNYGAYDSKMKRYLQDGEIDFQIIRLCKVATRAGLEFLLENKYMN